MAKRAASPYVSGRSSEWRKLRRLHVEDFVVVGLSEPRGGRTGFGALHLAAYEGDALVYCGRVGSGFDEKLLQDLAARLERDRRETAALRRAGPERARPDVGRAAARGRGALSQLDRGGPAAAARLPAPARGQAARGVPDAGAPRRLARARRRSPARRRTPRRAPRPSRAAETAATPRARADRSRRRSPSATWARSSGRKRATRRATSSSTTGGSPPGCCRT